MSASVQSSETSQGPTSPKKRYHQTEGKGSLEESIHNVRHLDLNMARSNHSIVSTLESSHGSEEEIVEVEETETCWEDEQEKEENKRNDNDDDDSSYEEVESVVEEEIVESDDEDEEMEDVAPSSSPVLEEGANELDKQKKIEQETKPYQAVPKVSAPQSIIVSKQDNADVDDGKDLTWEKPAWTKSPVLKNTAKGKFMKEGGTVSAPITNIAEVAAEKKDLSFKKPDWTKNTKLRSTGKADVLKTEGNLAKPITSLPHLGKQFDKDEPTMLEKSTGSSSLLVNNKPTVNSQDDDQENCGGDKTIGWEKPDWTKKPVLKGTAKGDKLKSGGTLSRPIGGIKPVD
jgi:hypothetical protein